MSNYISDSDLLVDSSVLAWGQLIFSRRIMPGGDLLHEPPFLWLVVVSCSLLTDLLRNRPEGGAIS
ncbi:MAG: hypothetical protein WBB15_15930 [Ornithinimicrobium sp.]